MVSVITSAQVTMASGNKTILPTVALTKYGSVRPLTPSKQTTSSRACVGSRG